MAPGQGQKYESFINLCTHVPELVRKVPFQDFTHSNSWIWSNWTVREAPLRKLQPPNGHFQNGEGGQNACQDGLGHLFREELSMFKGAFACFGGV